MIYSLTRENSYFYSAPFYFAYSRAFFTHKKFLLLLYFTAILMLVGYKVIVFEELKINENPCGARKTTSTFYRVFIHYNEKS